MSVYVVYTISKNWPGNPESVLHRFRGKNLEGPEPVGPGVIDRGEAVEAFLSQSFVSAELRFVVHVFG